MPTSATLASLPTELKASILRHVLIRNWPIDIEPHPNRGRPPLESLSILRVSREFFAIGVRVLYSQNRFRICDQAPWPDRREKGFQSPLSFLQSITLTKSYIGKHMARITYFVGPGATWTDDTEVLTEIVKGMEGLRMLTIVLHDGSKFEGKAGKRRIEQCYLGLRDRMGEWVREVTTEESKTERHLRFGQLVRVQRAYGGVVGEEGS